ncbi:MAG: hypothetical protein ABIS29_02765, partial [Vicinamibacterales bacterium]
MPRMPTDRSFCLAAVVVLLAFSDGGVRARPQQPASTPPPLTPESLSIPEQPPSPPPSALLLNYPAVSAARLKQPA